MNIFIDKSKNEGLAIQVYNQIKRAIHNGDIPGGKKLPSTRELASSSSISRNTVIEAYDQLHIEGYLYTKPGSGYFASKNMELEIDYPMAKPVEIENISMEPDSSVIDFKTGVPNLGNLPTNTLGSIAKEVYTTINPEDLGYSSPQGIKELREEIIKYTSLHRGVKAHPDQVIIVSGTTQAIGLISKIIVDKARKIAIEDPITRDIRDIINSNSGAIEPVPVDREGIKTNLLKDIDFGAVYTTPSHHYPLGYTMSLERRVELIKISKIKGAYIVEDDYDSEFRYESKPIPCLQGLAPERVIYIGTFSKTLYPGLRIAYMILPSVLINSVRKEKWLVDLHNPVVDQIMLSRFIKGGHYIRLLVKQKKHYRKLRDHLIAEVSRLIAPTPEIIGSSTGMHLCLKFHGFEFTDNLIDEIYLKGLKIYSVEEHCYLNGTYRDTLVVGYGSLSREQITKGLEILRSVLCPDPGI